MMRLPGGVLAAFGSLPESEYLAFLSDAERFFASVLDEDGERAEAVQYLIEVATFIDQIISEGRYHFHESDYMLLDRKQFVQAIASVRELLIDAEFEPSLAGIETFDGERTLSSVQDEFVEFLDVLEGMIPTFDRITLQQWLRYWDASRIDSSDDDAPVVIRADDLPEQVQLQVPEEFGLHAVFDDAGRLIRLEHYENGVPSLEYLDVNPDLQAAYEVSGIEKEEGKDPSVSPADYAVYYYDWIWDRIERFCKRYEKQLLECSFCAKTQAEVLKMIAGPSVFICNECVRLCNDILGEELEAGQEN